MNLPSAEQYLEIVETKAFGNLATLNHHRFIINERSGSYLFHRSPKAIVLKSEYRGGFYAVRFFLKDDPELFGRYVQTQTYLKDKALPWKLPFEFLDKEFYPAVKMEWIDSLSFGEYLHQIIGDEERLSQLQSKLVALSRSLEESKTGHGNLNLQHVRLVRERDDYTIRLIDYDSMYVPVFEKKHSLAAGTAGFQHPRRLASDFSPTMDRFTFWIFLTALEAFKTDPELWKATRRDDPSPAHLLFTYRDLASPEQSATFQLLKTYGNPALQFYTDKLTAFCVQASLAKVETPALYQQSGAAAPKSGIPVQSSLNERPKPSGERNATEAVKPITPVTPREKIIEHQPAVKREPAIPVKAKPNPVPQKTRVSKSSIPVMTIEKPVMRETTTATPKTSRNPRPVLVSAAIILILIAAYFAWPKPAKVEAEQQVQTVTENSTPVSSPAPVQQPEKEPATAGKKQTVFTTANLTQFLFQLYHSYNKRDLRSILSNYGERVQYYDAGTVSKQELSGIIDDLFIKPAYYECQPDLRTLSFQQQNDGCTIRISVKETIKPDARSKAEKYTSTLEYRLDKDFHILSEKRVS